MAARFCLNPNLPSYRELWVERKETMRFSDFHYFPLAKPFFLILVFLFVLLITLIEVGILGYACEKMGIDRRCVFTLLLLSLIGSYVNIPVAELPAKQLLSDQGITFFGMRYVIPLVQEWRRTVIAVNVGGAGTFDGIFLTGILAVLLA